MQRGCRFGGEMRAASNFSIKFVVKSTDESGSCDKFAMSGNEVLTGKVKQQQQQHYQQTGKGLLRFMA